MFIQTEATFDPKRLRFLPGRDVLTEGVLDLHNASEAEVSPLARALFAVPGVVGVRLDGNSITVTKAEGEWAWLKPPILAAIMDHFTSGAPVLEGAAQPTAGGDPALEPVWDALRRVIDPELGYNIVDLGLVYDVEAQDGAVSVVMTTTTPGCPATGYLQQGAGDAVGDLPGVEHVDVVLTYEPRWAPEMMSREAKAHFGIAEGAGW
jgi:metal-sulfur cluster biosynthetic enzyme